MKTYESTPHFAVAKRRVPLAKIETSGGVAAAKMGRVLGAANGRPKQVSTFNSAL
ncbi:FxSxx-COOH protein [Streptomyces sp. NBC_01754]|uniref:FxSxx-COOH cyclophane-containing RiPP peptide n=1 Tax=Streptomyces sp. NBC_01754 TaxID=2975930 RepID=UPI002DD9EDCD|nr:FxSxx-COOH cyclophane-containing RiPP peptide [Streptomyces sp. NBC_01754]WSC91717.1 FxSxx-COOH protein [Streptomyces sp. NBC_01754]